MVAEFIGVVSPEIGLCSDFEESIKAISDIDELTLLKKSISYKRSLSKDDKRLFKEAIASRIQLLNKATLQIDKPILDDNAPIAVVLFAGGGGVEAGMLRAGIRPVVAVELDPKHPQLSADIIRVHESNFADYGCKIINQTVEEVAKNNFADFPRKPDFLHASNVCKHFSNATGIKNEDREQQEDIDAARAVVTAIEVLQPKNFTLEQVRGFKQSQSFKLILECLESCGYKYYFDVINLADYGVPQARDRLFLSAAINGEPIPLPPVVERVGWYDAIAHLIPTMTDSVLLPSQQASVTEYLASNAPTPLLMQRTGSRKEVRARPAHLPAYTQLASRFTDGKLANRNKFADIWLPDGSVKSLSLAAAAIIQGFPDWYQFPASLSVAGTIIGNSVPPLFATRFFSGREVGDGSQEAELCFQKVGVGTLELSPFSLVKISEIIENSATQSREGINKNVVLEYLDLRKSGVEFPPILLFSEGNQYFIADGWHRYLAEKLLGSESISAEIRLGSLRDAVLYSCGANQSHGLRRSNQDKRKAVLTLLEDAEWSKFSNREIARRCGVDEGMVRKFRTPRADKQQNTLKEVFPRDALLTQENPKPELRGERITLLGRIDENNYAVGHGNRQFEVPISHVMEILEPTKPTSLCLADLGIPASGLPVVARNEGMPPEEHLEKTYLLQVSINQIAENSDYLSATQTSKLVESINFSLLSAAELKKVLIQIQKLTTVKA